MLTVVLGIALAAKTALFGYLQAAGPLPSVPLSQPLAAFPTDLERWAGRDVPVSDPRIIYGDERLNRTYCGSDGQRPVWLWMVYSASGEDRGHHPEVCMRAAGMPEDPAGRAAVSAEGHPQAIQQYRFGRAGDGAGLLVFYWHYTLYPRRDEGAGSLQRAYQRCQLRPSSLTIEVFTRAVAAEDVAVAQEFVRDVDRAIQTFLPPGAARGSARLPVFLVNEGGMQAR